MFRMPLGAALLLPILSQAAPQTFQVVNLAGENSDMVNTTELRRVIPYYGVGPLFVGSSTVADLNTAAHSPRKAIKLVYINPAGTTASLPAARNLFGHGDDIANDVAIDPSGNIWVVGTTNSDDFPLVNPLISQKAPYRDTGFIAELDASGSRILFSSFLGGHLPTLPLQSTPTRATNLTIDTAGNVYVLGTTNEADFPQTAPAIIPANSPTNNASPLTTHTFVVKILADKGSFSSLLIGAYLAHTVASGFFVDANGTLTVAGTTNAPDFPTTPNAFQPNCGCNLQHLSNGFAARISATNSLLWATYLQGTTIDAMAVDAVGVVYASGTNTGGFVTTPGVVQGHVPPFSGDVVSGNLCLAKLTADGSSLIYSTFLGGSKGAKLSGMALDAAGSLWITGSTSSPEFPSLPNTAHLGDDFVLELNANATALTQFYRLPTGTVTQSLNFDSDGSLMLLSSHGTLLRLNPAVGLAGPAVLGIGNAASQRLDAAVFVGELMSIYGVGLRPALGITGFPDSSGFYPTNLGGTQVLVGATPAPLLYAGPNQINFQFPTQRSGNSIQVVTTAKTLPVIDTGPGQSMGIFHLPNGDAAALNQDGTVNSAANAAALGSVITLFGTGILFNDNISDGLVAPSAYPYTLVDFENIQVTTNAGPGDLPILYLGVPRG